MYLCSRRLQGTLHDVLRLTFSQEGTTVMITSKYQREKAYERGRESNKKVAL